MPTVSLVSNTDVWPISCLRSPGVKPEDKDINLTHISTSVLSSRQVTERRNEVTKGENTPSGFHFLVASMDDKGHVQALNSDSVQTGMSIFDQVKGLTDGIVTSCADTNSRPPMGTARPGPDVKECSPQTSFPLRTHWLLPPWPPPKSENTFKLRKEK